MPKNQSFEERVPEYRFGIVLLLLLATFVVMTSADRGSWAAALVILLQGATLIAALAASNAKPRAFRIVAVFVGIAFVGALATAPLDTDFGRGVAFLLNALVVGVAPIVIARSLIRRNTIDIHTVMGAICIYVMLGMLWAFAYAAMGAFGSTPFFVQVSTTSTSDCLYFSFITLTTVGYGDLTAAGSLGRSFAVLEALTGQLYLVTVVALVVTQMARPRLALRDTEPDPNEPSRAEGPR